MIHGYRKVIIEGEDGLVTDAYMGYGNSSSTLYTTKGSIAAKRTVKTKSLRVLATGIVLDGSRVISSRELLSLGSSAIDKVMNCIDLANNTKVPVSIDLTADDVDGCIINSNISHKI